MLTVQRESFARDIRKLLRIVKTVRIFTTTFEALARQENFQGELTDYITAFLLAEQLTLASSFQPGIPFVHVKLAPTQPCPLPQ